jgi:hypothetical protein
MATLIFDEANQACQNFIESLKSEATRSQYKYCIQKYLQYKQYSEISQLFTKTDPKWIESDIIGYIVYLRKVRKLAHSTLNLYSCAVIQFYLINDILLNEKKLIDI